MTTLHERATQRDSEITKLHERVKELEEDLERVTEKLHKINNWCEAYPIGVFTEPDWNEVQSKLGNLLLTQVSGSNMRHVVTGIKKIIEGNNCRARDIAD